MKRISPKEETIRLGLPIKWNRKTSRGMNTITPMNEAMSKSTMILSASGCPFCTGGLKRSLSKSSLPGKTVTIVAVVATKSTPRNAQARGQSKVPAGKKSIPPKKTRLKKTLKITLKVKPLVTPGRPTLFPSDINLLIKSVCSPAFRPQAFGVAEWICARRLRPKGGTTNCADHQRAGGVGANSNCGDFQFFLGLAI